MSFPWETLELDVGAKRERMIESRKQRELTKGENGEYCKRQSVANCCVNCLFSFSYSRLSSPTLSSLPPPPLRPRLAAEAAAALAITTTLYVQTRSNLKC